jgi:hypothetical protein
MSMTDQSDLDKPDLRTDAQKFEDALRTVLTTPKEAVQKRMRRQKTKGNEHITP